MSITREALEATYLRAAQETSDRLDEARKILLEAETADNLLTIRKLVSEALDILDDVHAMAGMSAGISLATKKE